MAVSQVSESSFEECALSLFYYQTQKCGIYSDYIACRKINPKHVKKVEDIPFLPISFFKSHKVLSGHWAEQQVFTSSTTTGGIPSKHYVAEVDFYHQNCKQIFEAQFGPLKDWIFMPLLPAYAERRGSSLIEMVNYFISQSAYPVQKYYLYNHDELKKDYQAHCLTGYKICIIGVTFALTDMAEAGEYDFSEALIMETGGMKGRKQEWVRAQVHELLKRKFNVPHIASEYGMTELFSQAYAVKEGIYTTPATMRVYIRDVYDPFTLLPAGHRGAVNIIDLANVDSCAFIETQDLGFTHSDGSFEVIGRADHSEVRGCNLMVWS